MLSYRTVQPHTLELLRSLMCEPSLSQLRLVGGTSLALQLGHRTSIDIDLFGAIEFDDDALSDMLAGKGEVRMRNRTRIIRQFSIDGINVDIVDYKYPWLKEPLIIDGIRLASKEDIAAMKINAIDGSGSKKDFIDIYFLLQHYSIDEMLDFYQKKYGDASLFGAVMCMTYFDDADPQQMPRMFYDIDWNDIKRKIKKEICNHTNHV